MNCIQNKTSPNIGILLKGVLIPRLLNNPFASCFLINLDFLVLHTGHFGNIIVLPFLVCEISGLMLFVLFFFVVVFCTLGNKIALFYTLCFKRIALKEDNLQKNKILSSPVLKPRLVSNLLASCLLIF